MMASVHCTDLSMPLVSSDSKASEVLKGNTILETLSSGYQLEFKPHRH
jgi:hypothetical protein